MTTAAPLHLVQARFDVSALAREVSRARSVDDFDVGYLIHWALRRAFGDAAPSPFRVMGTSGRWTDVLAYGSHDAEDLRTLGRGRGEECGCDWSSVRTKRLPEKWPSAHRLRFEVRGCPVVRLAKPVAGHRGGAEVDAFLAASWRAGAPDRGLAREDIYATWLRDRVRAGGAALVESVSLGAFQRERLFRRTQGASREGRRLERPDVTFRGLLRVVDPTTFGAWLLHGVGRHRAFGFGMVLLRPG